MNPDRPTVVIVGESSGAVSLRTIINQVLGATQTDVRRDDPAEWPDDSEGIGPLDADLDLTHYEPPRAPNRAMRRAMKKERR